MGVLLKSIRKILVELIDRIDSGECATTDEQERMFLDLCTMIADKDDLVKITKVINGGTNGLEQRRAFLDKAKSVLLKN